MSVSQLTLEPEAQAVAAGAEKIPPHMWSRNAQHIGDGMNTKFAAFVIAMSLAMSLGISGGAQAKGCIRGAIAGGVAGHYAGRHHLVTGAAAGCIAARHYYKQEADGAAAGHGARACACDWPRLTAPAAGL